MCIRDRYQRRVRGAELLGMAASSHRIGLELNDKQQSLLIEAFQMFDKDNSGKIDASEFRNVCKQVGIVPTDSELAMMIEEIDLDNSGDIDMYEFVNAISAKMVDPEGEDHIRAAFQMFDTDDSGTLSHDELHQVLLHLGESMTPDHIDKLIDIADVNKDGEVDCREFMAMVPVSYTHLRAHETVLDLVCRLLLEKKKKKQQ
eukprot:TRINITY_DN28552_c0_g1_i1.p1 TRINITY_DN28552_c0_g1~~TRINITY_DN28552_c0_g1_i1.p1  ORF type:complete len:202 (-),score=85.57 TRINITY_DN28552_c0_g1_i1:66-671(-)